MILDHIALIISKEENLKFYEKLGFKEIKRIERSYDTVVFFKHEDVTLEIFIDSSHPERMNSPESLGLRHIAFCVDDLEKIMLMFPCEKVRTDWFGRRYMLTKDPDGQPIELKEKQ